MILTTYSGYSTPFIQEVGMKTGVSRTRGLAGTLLALGLIVFACSASVLPCSCVPELDVLLALDQADAVFAGRVVGLSLVPRFSEDPTISYATEDLEVIVAVHSQWKSELSGNTMWKRDVSDCAVLYTTFTCCVCGFNFKIGQAYLIYAFEQDGLLRTSICTRTMLLSDASDDLVVLGNLAPASLWTSPELGEGVFQP
jgi:hypothetical protein